MPKPKPGEKQSEWMGRCVPVAVDEGRKQNQAVAMCMQMFRDKDKKREARTVLVGAAVAEGIRTAQFSGREHLVVPVVALVGDAVIEALGSAGPEFIPAAVVEASVAGWRGEPVMADHPSSEDGRLLSANEPEVLEAASFGRIFHPVYKDKRLTVEAYIDPELAVAAGAEGLLERLRAGQTVEVSIGAYVRTEARQGIHAGQRYGAVWTDILPDHLALLPEGSIGACSVAMGCGAPRAASYRITTSTDLEEADMTEKTFVERFAQRLAALLGDDSEPELKAACACEETHQQSAVKSAQEEAMAEAAKVEESAPALETVPTKPAEVPVAAAPVLPAPPAMEQLPAAELASLRAMAAKEIAREAARKAELVANLRGAQSRFDEARLSTMSVEQLEDVAALVGVPAPAPIDYSLRMSPRAATAIPDSIPPPDAWGLAKKLVPGASAGSLFRKETN